MLIQACLSKGQLTIYVWEVKTATNSSDGIVSALLTFDTLTLPLLLEVCHFLTDIKFLFSNCRTKRLSIKLRTLNERKLLALLFRFIL